MGHVSNVFGRVNPVEKMAELAHSVGALMVCDAAQSAPHIALDVQKLGVDFLVFSGHKLCGPMGIGALWARMELLEDMPPFLRGGEMIEYVTRDSATWAEVPHKFEAGTVNASGAVGLEAAIRYLQAAGLETIESHVNALTERALKGMQALPHVHVIGSENAGEHSGILTFTVDGVHPHDIAAIFDSDRICIRAGHHCAQPLMKHLGVGSTARASIYLYNNEQDVDRFLESLATLRSRMGYGE
jgi:cysteine desulfurase/selenocysteine lyase